jgi:hypothetical protein
MEIVNEPTAQQGSPAQQEFLPEAGNALTLSIWGNAVSFLYMIPFFGVLACVAGIILSIAGLKKGRSGMDEFKANKGKYYGGSFAKTLVAFILGIVGIVQGALLSIYGMVFSFVIINGGMHHMFRHMF